MARVRDLSGNGGRFGVGNPDQLQGNESIEGYPTGKRADNDPLRMTFGQYQLFSTFDGAPTDVWQLSMGTAGPTDRAKILKLRSLIISGSATAASNIILYLLKRTGLGSGGTVATGNVATSHDSIDDAPLGQVRVVTVNRTSLATGLGTLHGARLNLSPPANGAIDRIFWQWSWMNDKCPTIRGAESLNLNLGGVAMPAGGALEVDAMWTEEYLP